MALPQTGPGAGETNEAAAGAAHTVETAELVTLSLPYSLAVALAADTYAARQTRAAHPAGHFQSDGRFFLSFEEYSFVPEHVQRPTREQPYTLMNYARSKDHVAALFNVAVEDLSEEVARRARQRERSTQRRAAREGDRHGTSAASAA